MRVGSLLLLVCVGGAAVPVAAQRAAAAPAPKGSAKPALLVTGVRVVVDQGGYQGPCPAKLLYTATITAAAPLTAAISYQWVRSTGAKGPKRTVRMTGTTATVTDRWSLGAVGQMMRPWSELQILSPNRLVSNQVVTEVLCH